MAGVVGVPRFDRQRFPSAFGCHGGCHDAVNVKQDGGGGED
jgi:hypothetical protein